MIFRMLLMYKNQGEMFKILKNTYRIWVLLKLKYEANN